MKLYREEDLKLYGRGPKKGLEPIPHQKVAMRCDDCGIDFLRCLSFVKEAPHRCKRCATTHYNLTRDPSIHAKMIAKAREVCIGKTIEERIGEDRGVEFRRKLSLKHSGENNPNFGGKYSHGFADNNPLPKGSTYEEAFGVERANEMKAKISAKTSGSRNGMYGRPQPRGSGNGWQGWYRGVYFTSFLELSFMIGCERKGVVYETLSSKKSYAIQYDLNGVIRNYFPDFKVGEKIIEVKPKSLLRTIQNEAKFQSARALLGENFVIVTEDDIEKISVDEVKELWYNGTIVFIDRYDAKFRERYA
jgi:hypothetical protein